MSTRWFVSRHIGASHWLENQGINIDRQVAHLNLSDIQAGDQVFGTLPIHLAAAVCAKGASYFHLSLELPVAYRGKELSADQMQLFNARLEQFAVSKIANTTAEYL